MSVLSTPTAAKRLRDLNSRYSDSLQAKPLSTKVATLVFFALLNEQLASFFAGDVQKLELTIPFSGKKITVPHTLTSKVPLMGLFAGLINAPLTHYGYQLIQKLIPQPLTPRKKLMQILLSTGVLTPIFCACFVSWIGLMNNLTKMSNTLKTKPNEKQQKLIKRLKLFFGTFFKIILSSLKGGYIKVASTSVITSPLFMLLAQKFVSPEAWSVFFAFCYFVVGTYNNTKVKIIQKKLKDEKSKGEVTHVSQDTDNAAVSSSVMLDKSSYTVTNVLIPTNSVHSNSDTDVEDVV